MAALTVAILLLLSWRLVSFGDLNLLLTVFWFLWPDLVPFVPIGMLMRGRREWPSWGSLLYNTTHTFLVWLPVFLLWSLSIGRIEWPLLAWAGHISMDRTVGYYLREMKPP